MQSFYNNMGRIWDIGNLFNTKSNRWWGRVPVPVRCVGGEAHVACSQASAGGTRGRTWGVAESKAPMHLF